MMERSEAGGEWPLLPWLLAALGAFAGLAGWLLLDGMGEDVPWRVGLAAFVAFTALALGFTLERVRPVAALMFSVAVGLVLGGLAFHLVRSGDSMAGVEYGFAAGALACVLALPLFQAGFLATRFATSYERVHFEVWTDAVAGAGAGAFALLSFALLWLVHGLLSLVGIEIIEDLMQQGWLAPVWLAGSFGAALGVLREHLKVIGGLQAVALLAVPLAAALLVVLAALVASGGEALWSATDSATPVLLICAAGSWVLVNAVIRDDDAAGSRSRVMRIAALVLALGILPLAVFAAISMGVRIDQHGLAPERLWGLVAIAVAVAFGLAYLVAVLRRRAGGWADRMRAANLRLAAGVCVLALILALPVVDFGAISASNQVARLEAGKVSAEDFDYSALRWDFGDAGRRALARLAERGGEAAELAAAMLAQDERFYPQIDGFARGREDFALRVQPDDPSLRRLVLDYLVANPWLCEDRCVALALGPAAGGARDVAIVQGGGYQIVRLGAGRAGVRAPEVARAAIAMDEDSTIEIREVPTRYIFIDGRRVGPPLETDTAPLEGMPPPR